MEQLEENALLGLDIDFWPHIIKVMKKEGINRVRKIIQEEEKATSFSVSTRAQGKQQLEQKGQTNGKDRIDDYFCYQGEESKQYWSRTQGKEYKKAQRKDSLSQDSLSWEKLTLKLIVKQEEDPEFGSWKKEEQPWNRMK